MSGRALGELRVRLDKRLVRAIAALAVANGDKLDDVVSDLLTLQLFDSPVDSCDGADRAPLLGAAAGEPPGRPGTPPGAPAGPDLLGAASSDAPREPRAAGTGVRGSDACDPRALPPEELPMFLPRRRR